VGEGVLIGAPDAFGERDGQLWCDGVPLARIADEVGTPCYVYSAKAIATRYAALATAFAGSGARIAYSVKANHNLAVLRLLHRLGAGADVVSGGELARALRAGFAGADIVFGGVGKTCAELAAGLDAGVALFNVESVGELDRLERLAAARGARAPVALRINPGVAVDTHAYTQTGHYATKFGIAWEDAEAAYARCSAAPHLDPVGIDVHIGSQIASLEPYRVALARVREVAARIRAAGVELRWLDVGGGFGIGHDGGPTLDVAALADLVAETARACGATPIVEPGRWLVAPAGVLLARVEYVKRLGDRTYVVTDTGSNDFLRPSYYGAVHPIVPLRRAPAALTADVVGPVCETGDFLGRDCRLPAVREGEVLAVGFAGAYGFVMSSNYNSRPRAAEVLVEGDRYRVVRRRETLAHLWAAEVEPEHGGGEGAPCP
jgi:diaminopimelate decarboxylase